MIALYLGIVVAWTLVCVTAGRLYEDSRQRRADLIQRDAWVARYQHDQIRKTA